MNDVILSSREAAAYLGISVNYLYRLHREGKIPCYKPFGNKCYFSKNEMLELVKSKPIKKNPK